MGTGQPVAQLLALALDVAHSAARLRRAFRNQAIMGRLVGQFADRGQVLVDAAIGHPACFERGDMRMDGGFVQSWLAGLNIPGQEIVERPSIGALAVRTDRPGVVFQAKSLMLN